MKKNDILKTENGVFRILDIDEVNVLAIDCEKKTMPQFFPVSFFENGKILEEISSPCSSWEELSPAEKKIAQKRYTMIAATVAVINDKPKPNAMYDGLNQCSFCKYSRKSFVSFQIKSIRFSL